jgi:hypothetical protein
MAESNNVSVTESSPVETSTVTVSVPSVSSTPSVPLPASPLDSVVGVAESPTVVLETAKDVVSTVVKEATTSVVSDIKEKLESNEDVKKAKEAVSNAGVKIMGTVSEVFSDKHLSGMVKLIVDDPVFIAKVEASVKTILKDGKVDESDVPEFIFLIMEAYNSLPKAKLTKEELPEFVSCVYNYLVEKYNLIPKDQRAKYETLVASSVKLVLMAPQLQIPSSWKCPCW